MDLYLRLVSLVDERNSICIGRFFSLSEPCEEKTSHHELISEPLVWLDRNLTPVFEGNGQGLINVLEDFIRACCCPQHRNDSQHVALHLYFWFTAIIWGVKLDDSFLGLIKNHGPRLDVAASYDTKGYITRQTIHSLPPERAMLLYKGAEKLNRIRHPTKINHGSPILFKNWLEERVKNESYPYRNVDSLKIRLARYQWEVWHQPQRSSIIQGTDSAVQDQSTKPPTARMSDDSTVNVETLGSLNQTLDRGLHGGNVALASQASSQCLHMYRSFPKENAFLAVPQDCSNGKGIFDSFRYNPDGLPQRWSFIRSRFRERQAGLGDLRQSPSFSHHGKERTSHPDTEEFKLSQHTTTQQISKDKPTVQHGGAESQSQGLDAMKPERNTLPVVNPSPQNGRKRSKSAPEVKATFAKAETEPSPGHHLLSRALGTPAQFLRWTLKFEPRGKIERLLVRYRKVQDNCKLVQKYLCDQESTKTFDSKRWEPLCEHWKPSAMFVLSLFGVEYIVSMILVILPSSIPTSAVVNAIVLGCWGILYAEQNFMQEMKLSIASKCLPPAEDNITNM